MSIGFYTASQGVLEMQKAMDVISNNVANVSTAGFKPLRPSFSDLIYTVRNKNDEDVETGHGTKIDKTDLMFDIGSITSSTGQLDFATQSEGLFALQKADGTIVYSKNGAFAIKQNGEQWNVVDSIGSNVLDYDGNPIIAEFDEEGNINKEAILESLGVYKFSNPYGLKPDGDNYYLATESSGEATADRDLEKLSGYLEASSSDMADQMVKVIQYQRAFSFNSKMVQTADEVETLINNLR